MPMSQPFRSFLMVSHANLNAFWSTLQCCKKIASKVHVKTIVRDCSLLLTGFTYKEQRPQRNLEPQAGSARKSPEISEHFLARSHHSIFQSKWKHYQWKILPHVRGAPACFSREVVKIGTTIREGSYTLWASPQQKMQLTPGRASAGGDHSLCTAMQGVSCPKP